MTELNATELLGLPTPSPYRSLSQQYRDKISSPKPQIFQLHDDLLWLIFWLNADMEDEAEKTDEIAAIDTLRYSSQVCSRWRQIILSFSSLWAQVVNLSYLEQDDWREEVLQRTGKSLLSVLWGQPRRECISEDVAAEILGCNWDRIRSLKLDLNTSAYWMDHPDFNIAQFWEIFQRPSEVLEIFRVIFQRLQGGFAPILSPSNFVIFDNFAPSLRVFLAPNMKFTLDSPCLANLRYLSLNCPVSAYDIIQAIPHMPLLECLADETSNAITSTGDALSSLAQITAPSINEIVLSSNSDLGPYVDFLAQIKPAAGCYLTFSHTDFILNVKALTVANQVLYRYSRCCDFPSATNISLDLHQYRFSFAAQIPRKAQFCFRLNYYCELPRGIIEALFAALPLVKFQDAKTLTLRISPLAIEPSNRRISQFILSAPSVETLVTNNKTIGFLLNLPSDVLALSFPALHTVKITYYIRPEELWIIKRFLISRISINKPVAILYIPIDRNFTDLRPLEEITGLTIILQDGDHEYEHTCGNGRIEELLFPHSLRAAGFWLTFGELI